MYMAWKYDGSSVDPHLPCSNCQGTHQRFHPPVETGQVSASEHGEAPKSPKKSSSRGWPWLTVAMLVGHPTYVWGAKMLRVNNEIAMCTTVCNDSSFLPMFHLHIIMDSSNPAKLGIWPSLKHTTAWTQQNCWIHTTSRFSSHPYHHHHHHHHHHHQPLIIIKNHHQPLIIIKNHHQPLIIINNQSINH